MRQISFTRKHHTARFESPAAYYSFVFSLPLDTDIHKLADNLLRQNIAEVAVAAGADRLRFAYRRQEQKKAQAHLRGLATFETVVNNESTFPHWAARNPRLAAWLIRKRLVKFHLKASDTPPDPELAQTLKGLDSVATQVDEILLQEGILTGAAAVVDRTLLLPSYLASEPFIRLELGTIRAECDALEDADLVVLLLLHRSGVAILTFIGIPGSRTTDELLAVAVSSNIAYKRTVLPSHIGRALAVDGSRVISDQWLEDGAWRDIAWRDAIPLQSLFEGYAGVICSLARKGGDFDEWMCYVTLFVDGLNCCGSKVKWHSCHDVELAGLVARDRAYASIKKTQRLACLAGDLALRESQSSYFEIGSSLVISWAFGRDMVKSSPVDHFHTTVVVEGVLLKYWQLRALDLRLTASVWTQSNLEDIQRQLITGLDEYRSTKLLWGTARDIERDLSKKLELDRSYRNILDRLDAIQKLIDARVARLASRRNTLFAGIGALAAVLLGMSAIKDILSVVSKIDTHRFPGLLGRPLVHFARAGDTGAWELYLILLTLVTILSWAGFFVQFRRDRKHLTRPFGVEWDGISYSMGAPSYRAGKVEDAFGAEESE